MIRLFEEHQVRKTTELSSSLWDFSQVTDGKNTPVGKVTVPSCWESYPGFEAYRGQDRKSTRLNSSHRSQSRMPSSA